MSTAFDCFGGTCAVHADPGAATRARSRLLEWHARFSRFEPGSELSRLNRDPRPAVPVSATMARLIEAIAAAGEATGGLVDGTLAGEIAAAGYDADLGAPLPLAAALALAPARRPAGASAAAGWRRVRLEDGILHRPPGVMIDGGGLAKGLFADLIAEGLELNGSARVATLQLAGAAATLRFAGPPRDAGPPTYAVDCAGDLRIGGTPREVHVASPFGGAPLHTFRLGDAGVATSGIGRRSWLGPDGMPAHHLLDPATGRPAFTGVVQATAIAPTALEAEWRAKAAILSGPDGAAGWLPHGGVVVLDDGDHVVLEPS